MNVRLFANWVLEELSQVHQKYGYTVELVPLPPGHAWNRTDARIARMNTYLDAIKAKGRVFGAKGIAEAFRLSADPASSKPIPCVTGEYYVCSFRIASLQQGGNAPFR